MARKHGKYLVDPLSADHPDFEFSPTEDPDCADHDSEDSNRESAEANDYPDEDLLSDSDDHQQQRRYSDDYDGIVLGSAKKLKSDGCQNWLD